MHSNTYEIYPVFLRPLKFISETITVFFAVGRFAVWHFAIGQFVVRTLCRGIVRRRDPCMQNTEEIITKYDVDANLFRLESTNPEKKYPALGCFLVFLRQNLPRQIVPRRKILEPSKTYNYAYISIPRRIEHFFCFRLEKKLKK